MNSQLARSVSESEVLGPHVRTGREGHCLACKQPISAHVSGRGQWLGCTAALVGDVPFNLIPARRRNDSPVSKMARNTTTSVPSVKRQTWVYACKDGRVKPETLVKMGVSPARVAAYRAIYEAKAPLRVEEVAKRAKRPLEATRFSLNSMAENGPIRRMPA